MADIGPWIAVKKKPAVSILIVQPVSGDVVEHVLWGLEEEGISYEIAELESGAPEAIAKQAADGSQLNVGIGIDGKQGKAVLHHRDLHEEKPLFSVGLNDSGAFELLRALGGNAARLVKGDPLIFPDGASTGANCRNPLNPPPADPDEDEFVKIITKLVVELLDDK